MPSLKREHSPIDVLERVVKGVHVESHGPHNHRVMPRPLDRINDSPPTPAKRSRRRTPDEPTANGPRRQSRKTSSKARRAAK